MLDERKLSQSAGSVWHWVTKQIRKKNNAEKQFNRSSRKEQRKTGIRGRRALKIHKYIVYG